MTDSGAASDRIDGWARKRAPELLRRAEAEALELLRDALVKAALGESATAAGRTAPRGPRPDPRQRGQTASRRPSAPAPARPAGDALWAYCVLRSNQELTGGVRGVNPDADVHAVAHDGLAVLVSRVPLADFGEEPLRDNLNDLAWLERVARAHESVLEAAMETGPVVPLRLCTIFSDEDGVRAMLAHERESLAEALDRLDGRQEWGVKLLVDPKALAAAAHERSAEVAALEEELAARTGGGAYMVRRRLERSVSEVTDRLAAELADDVHARLNDWARDSVLSAPQNRELSGHEGDMLLNGAYLVDADRTGELRELLGELERRHRELGARLELTGPWPPYNFVARGAAAPA